MQAPNRFETHQERLDILIQFWHLLFFFYSNYLNSVNLDPNRHITLDATTSTCLSPDAKIIAVFQWFYNRVFCAQNTPFLWRYGTTI